MKKYITVEQAIAILPNRDEIHTFYNGGFGLLGADWGRAEIIDKLQKSDHLELTGPSAKGMGHGLCAYDNSAKYHSDILFIETDAECLERLEASLEADLALIEREAALEICEKEYQERLRMHDYCGDAVAWNIGGAIKALPNIDAAPVVHGRWIDKCVRDWHCSECDFEIAKVRRFDGYSYDDKPNYCPNCGCKMDGGEGHEAY